MSLKNPSFAELTAAREVLELPERASLALIKANYRALLRRYHPDTCSGEPELCLTMTRKITDAYKIVLSYCDRYEFSFTEEEIQKNCSAEEWWLKRFGNTPWWG